MASAFPVLYAVEPLVSPVPHAVIQPAFPVPYAVMASAFPVPYAVEPLVSPVLYAVRPPALPIPVGAGQLPRGARRRSPRSQRTTSTKVPADTAAAVSAVPA
ncbi:hypothetical protein ACFWA5_40650 [Streptomyces mirabilis]|uniref:hypothetical protein n=1 Tax=Streptomyces mirabilis TaxID=68239 RepID=UPI00365395FF